ncbi:3-methyl-2-oxobutanoate hydroxymethyltransferase [bacterium]|nr:3-methyl-2-oxobutanoate hydroxymethyltransferase [bacterium]
MIAGNARSLSLSQPQQKVSPQVPPAPPGVLKKVRTAHLLQMKQAGRPITMVTAYDAPSGALADEAGMDVILVGDSVGMVVHGMETTLPVTVDMMVMHTQAVARGSHRTLIVTDLPFMSYQVSVEQALQTAGRIMKEGGCAAVKLETGSESILPTVRALVEAGIPVMGHIGLVPQSINALGGYRVQGRDPQDAEHMLRLAQLIEAAGAFAIVLEMIPAPLAERITRALRIPVIGIGAGPQCDGQVIVLHDVIGITEHPPRFARKYLDGRAGILRAFRKYARDVRERSFPGPDETIE